jgi:hypothetical protein
MLANRWRQALGVCCVARAGWAFFPAAMTEIPALGWKFQSLRCP